MVFAALSNLHCDGEACVACSPYRCPRQLCATLKEYGSPHPGSDAITKDYRKLEQYYNEVVDIPGNHDHQQRCEEVVVYPAFEKHLGAKGKEMAGYDRMEHHQSTDEEYVPKLREIWGSLSSHLEEGDMTALESNLWWAQGEY
ncbi:hypothetical protein Purlil1_10234 [Purpureocillium lilacinum]|uniref:Uncharacterized protein n=1 Tax=Purpureocillium lilacinum TaxID=33203 RepID=A0ABR0BMX6_PURLI|nr:hypothetical protein Purlil1_10234 [Purpureocillium lilacinum]